MGLSRSVAERPLRDWQRLVYEQAMVLHPQPEDYLWWYLGMYGAHGRFLRGRRVRDVRLRNTSLREFGPLLLVVSEIVGISLAEAMAMKFPLVCVRCELPVCDCDPNNPAPKKRFTPANAELLDRTPRFWQCKLKDMYGAVNRRAGIGQVSMHHFEEMGECSEALREGTEVDRLEEVADVYAWWNAELNCYRISSVRIFHHFVQGKLPLYRPPDM